MSMISSGFPLPLYGFKSRIAHRVKAPVMTKTLKLMICFIQLIRMLFMQLHFKDFPMCLLLEL